LDSRLSAGALAVAERARRSLSTGFVTSPDLSA
jgi:hypothetical protein